MLHAKFMVSALSRVKTIKLLCLYHESVPNSVIARVRNCGSHFLSNPKIFAGDLNFFRNSGVSARRELTVLAVKLLLAPNHY